jgi:hypothetical protein
MSDLDNVQDTTPHPGDELHLSGSATADAPAKESTLSETKDATEPQADTPEATPGADQAGECLGEDAAAKPVDPDADPADDPDAAVEPDAVPDDSSDGCSPASEQADIPAQPQCTEIAMACSTTDATPAAFGLGDCSPDADDLAVSAVAFPCETNKTYALLICLAARKDDGTSAMFVRQAVIKNVNDTVSLEGAVQTVGADVNPAGWSVAISADDTKKCLQILAAGAEGANIRWAAVVQAVEIPFSAN